MLQALILFFKATTKRCVYEYAVVTPLQHRLINMKITAVLFFHIMYFFWCFMIRFYDELKGNSPES